MLTHKKWVLQGGKEVNVKITIKISQNYKIRKSKQTGIEINIVQAIRALEVHIYSTYYTSDMALIILSNSFM